ncbi:MAG: hypothetical protein R3C18_18255 [Planctomycetaceae bacterium]
MSVNIAGNAFSLNVQEEEDGLGYSVYWEAQVPAAPLTTWGRGAGQLGAKPLPVACISNSEEPPLPHQQAAVEWLLANFDDVAKRIQAQCESAWKGCYYWEGNEMEDDDEYWVEGVRIPPGESFDWVSIHRSRSLPALIVIDFDQCWELEHAFYVVIDPTDSRKDCWTTWDGMGDMGLIYEEDNEDEDDDDFDSEEEFEDGFDDEDFDDD